MCRKKIAQTAFHCGDTDRELWKGGWNGNVNKHTGMEPVAMHEAQTKIVGGENNWDSRGEAVIDARGLGSQRGRQQGRGRGCLMSRMVKMTSSCAVNTPM